MTNIDSQTIRSDLPCSACQYNLRGLTDADKCPECGSKISATLAHRLKEHERALRKEKMKKLAKLVPRAATCDPAALIQWGEGMGCIIASYIITVAAICMAYNRDFNAPRSNTRVVTLCTLITGWVLGSWGMWKTTVRETDDRPHAKRVRIPLALYTFLPGCLGLLGLRDRDVDTVVLFVGPLCAIAGPVLLITYYFRLNRLCKVLGWNRFGKQFYVIPFLIPFLVMLAPEYVRIRGEDASCLWDLLHIPSPLYGYARFVVQLGDPHSRSANLDMLLTLVSLWPVVCAALLMRRIIYIRWRVKVQKAGNAPLKMEKAYSTPAPLQQPSHPPRG
jgi:hypothetical protein